MIGLNLRLSQEAQAEAEMRNYLDTLKKAGAQDKEIAFLENLLDENPHTGFIHLALAQAYKETGRRADAIQELDAVVEMYLQAGNRQSAAEIIESILALDPPDKEGYLQLLAQVRGVNSAS